MIIEIKGDVSRQERILSMSSSNKGVLCPYQPVLCQEGYCHGCQVYLNWRTRGSSSLNSKASKAQYDE